MTDELERDSDQALVELDKGLRSVSKGDQIECVVSLSHIFDKHPFPIFLNSACLKLADCFNTSSNFVRLCIVRVFEESQRHLDKLQNVDEFISRIFQVVHSNDPIARAITVRCLAACAPILKERRNIHHAILEALNSNDDVEVLAALHGVKEFAKVSDSFNSGAIDTITQKIQIAPVHIKLELIQSLQYMDGTVAMAHRARTICEKLLDGFVAHDVVVNVLNVMTNLCCRTLTQVQEQVTLLLNWLVTDVRRSVQMSVLENLRVLLKRSPHQVAADHVQCLLTYAQNADDVQCHHKVLRILCTISGQLTLTCFVRGNDITLVESLIDTYAYHVDLQISATCLILCSKLVVCLPATFVDIRGNLLVGIQSLILTSVAQEDIVALKKSLMCVKLLSKLADSPEFYEVLITALKHSQESCKLLLCEAFMTLEFSHHVQMEDLLDVLTDCKHSERLVVMLMGVIFHFRESPYSSDDSALATIWEVVSSQNFWVIFRVARQALRYGQYLLACKLLGYIREQVLSETSFFYFKALDQYSQGQLLLSQISSDGADCVDMEKLDLSIICLVESQRSLQSVNASLNKFSFHARYLDLLTTELVNHKRLHCVTNMFWIYPPPAIGMTESARTGDDLVRYGCLSEELRKCSSDFHSLYAQYGSLQQTLLDADEKTQSHIKQLMERTLIMSQLIDTILTGERQFPLPVVQQTDHLLHTPKLTKLLNNIKSKWPYNPSVSEEHIISITSQQMQRLKESSLQILTEDRVLLPRFFFQRLQTTTATINVTPHQKPGESILVHNLSYLTLHVEGVLSYSSVNQGSKVRRVAVSISSSKQSSSTDASETDSLKKRQLSTDTDMVNTVKLAKNYFSTEFLLSFTDPGVYIIKITCFMVDCDGIYWDIGCCSELAVKSFKEKKHNTLMKSTI